MKRQTAAFGENADITSQTADKSEVISVLEGDEIRQINSEMTRENELSQSLNDDDAIREEDEELEEEEEVEASARANQA